MPKLCATLLLSLSFPALSGCGSMVSNLPVVGTPEGTPARLENPGEFPAIHDIPAPRDEAAMDAATRQRVQQDLISARDRQSKSQ